MKEPVDCMDRNNVKNKKEQKKIKEEFLKSDKTKAFIQTFPHEVLIFSMKHNIMEICVLSSSKC